MQNAVPAPAGGADAAPPVAERVASRTLSVRSEAYADEVRRLVAAGYAVMRRTATLEPRVHDIVREAGLSNQAFYRHFRGKDELLVAILDDGQRQLLTYLERRMAGADPGAARVRAWVEVVLAQARDPEAAAATRPFALNGDRLAVQFPAETQGSRDRLIEPLRDLVGESAALAIYHVAMGMVHDALIERRTPTRAEVDAVVEFALKGAGLGT